MYLQCAACPQQPHHPDGAVQKCVLGAGHGCVQGNDLADGAHHTVNATGIQGFGSGLDGSADGQHRDVSDCFGPAGHPCRDLSVGGLGVQTAFPGDDKVGLSHRLIEAGQIQNQVDAGTYVSVEKGQQAAAQAQAAVTDAAKKAYEDATAALDAYVREQSRRYTTADLHLTSLDFRCPLDSYGRITTQFAEPDPWGIPHRGTDFAAPGGTPIYAIADGVVSAARTMNSYGNCVQVSHGTADDGHRYDSLYAHMSSIAVAQGADVQKGDLLGYVGNTGNVYGAGGGYHLHLELRVDGSRVDPLGFVPTH